MTSCFIPRLLVVFTRQLEILVTTLDGGLVSLFRSITTPFFGLFRLGQLPMSPRKQRGVESELSES